MKIATWNLDRPPVNGWKRVPEIKKQFGVVDADLWVLTETHAAITPNDTFYSVCSEYDPALAGSDERWVILWSRWPLTRLATRPQQMTVCARVEHPSTPFVIYGTVLPDGTAKSWEPHYEAIAEQGADWNQLRNDYPQLPLCIAGDLNQNRNGPHWYGTVEGRARLTAALAENKLICMTEKLQTIDHICLSHDWAINVTTVHLWKGRLENQTYLTDHNGVVVTL